MPAGLGRAKSNVAHDGFDLEHQERLRARLCLGNPNARATTTTMFDCAPQFTTPWQHMLQQQHMRRHKAKSSSTFMRRMRERGGTIVPSRQESRPHGC
jgi:hypothetical protein